MCFPSKAPRQPRGEVLQPLHLEEGCRNSPACGHLGTLPSKMLSLQNQAWGRSCYRLGKCLQGVWPRSRIWPAAAPLENKKLPPEHGSHLCSPPGFLGSHTAARPSGKDANSPCSSAFHYGNKAKQINPPHLYSPKQ